MRVAAVQIDIKIGQVDQNSDRICSQIAKLGAEQVELAVFPECALSGYCFESREEALPFALEVGGPEIRRLASAANDAHLLAVVGFLERDGDRLYNSQVLVGGGNSRGGSAILGTYRKIHLPALGVDRFVDAGNRGPQVIDTGSARIGLAICYDCGFPELSRVLALEGADVIALSTNWPAKAREVAKVVPPCRALENHLYFVAANRIGEERGFTFCGLSSIFGPDGLEFGRAGDTDEQTLIADVDLKIARTKRIERVPGKHVVDLFADRRPEFYHRVVE